MNRLDRFVDIVDRHADRAIDAGLHLIYSVIFLLLFAYFLHSIAISISERGSNVNVPGYFDNHPQRQEFKGNRTDPDLDRQGFSIQIAEC